MRTIECYDELICDVQGLVSSLNDAASQAGTTQDNSSTPPLPQDDMNLDDGGDAGFPEKIEGRSGAQSQNQAGALLAMFNAFHVADMVYTVQSIEGTVVDIRNGKRPSPSDAYGILLGVGKGYEKLAQLSRNIERARKALVPLEEALEGAWTITDRDRVVLRERVQAARKGIAWLNENQPTIIAGEKSIRALKKGFEKMLRIPIYQSLLASAWLDLEMSWLPLAQGLKSEAQQLRERCEDVLLNESAMLRDM